MLKRLLLAALLVLVAAVVTSAQESTPEATEQPDSCPALVQTALELTRRNCDSTDVNEACYGYDLIDSQIREGTQDSSFISSGDTVPLSYLDSVRMSAMDVGTATWGLIKIRVEAAGSGSTLQPEDVQLVLYGDTSISNGANFVFVLPAEETPVYEFPQAGSEEIGTLEPQIEVLANSLLDTGDWLRIRYELVEGGSTLAWVEAAAVQPVSPLDVLPTMALDEALNPSDEELTFGPMQMMRLETGSDDAPCADAPNSGLLIQTPEGLGRITVVIDTVVFELEGTAYVTAQPGGEIRADVISGELALQAEGETVTYEAGESGSVALNMDAEAAGVPAEPEPIDLSRINNAPVTLLDNSVTLPGSSVQLQAGSWQFQFGVSSRTCPDGTTIAFESSGIPATIQPQEGALIVSGQRFDEIAPGTYARSYIDAEGSLHQDTLRVLDAQSIEGSKILDVANTTCTLTVPFSLRFGG